MSGEAHRFLSGTPKSILAGWLAACPFVGLNNVVLLMVVPQNTFDEDPMYLAMMISKCLHEERKILEAAQSADQVTSPILDGEMALHVENGPRKVCGCLSLATMQS